MPLANRLLHGVTLGLALLCGLAAPGPDPVRAQQIAPPGTGLSSGGLFGAEAKAAHFRVRPEVVNPDLPAFTATVEELGNGSDLTSGGGGFEPIIFRDMIIAEADSPDSILADPNVISHFDSWPEGAFDGAEIEVLRIVSGAFKTVREDRVAEGGYHASGWLPVLPSDRIIPADQTRYLLSWEGYNRLNGPWYYTVRAVDDAGRLSPPAKAVEIQPPAKPKPVGEKQTLIKTSASNDAADLRAPGNLSGRITISQTLMLSWDPVPGAKGYMIQRSDLPPERHTGYGIRLAGQGEPIRKGDMVILRKKFMLPPRAQVVTNRIWNTDYARSTFGNPLLPGLANEGGGLSRLVPHPADTPVPDPGETYLEIRLNDGKSFTLGKYNHGGTNQDFYPVLDPGKTYRFEVWLRGDGNITATFRLDGPLENTPGQPVQARIAAGWNKYAFDLKVPRTYSHPNTGRMLLTLSGRGQVDVDNLRIYRTDAPFMDLLPEDRLALRSSDMSALRTHMFVRTGTATYDLAQLTDPAGVPMRSHGNSLPQVLGITASVGMEPWLQIEPHFSRAEWLGLAEYLAAPFDPAKDDPKALPWAAKRVAQGRAAPWIDAFPKIYLELGNETWNQLFRPWVFPAMTDGAMLRWTRYGPGEVYGLYQEHVLSILRESPWWDRLAPKLAPVIGGWGAGEYGIKALKASPGSNILTNVSYIGGWDSGEGAVRNTPEGFSSVMVFTPQSTVGNAKFYRRLIREQLPDRTITTGTYESGPGYALNGLNGQGVSPEQQRAQELVMKSAAAGAATLDSFLARAQAGDRIQNYFTFGRGEYWTSHASWFRGGQAYPAWDWLALYNRIGRGDLLAVDTVDVPGQDLPKMGWRKEMTDAPMAAAYASRRGNSLIVTVVSRAVPDVPAGNSGRMSVQVDLPITAAKAVTMYHATGDFTAQNTDGQQTRIEREALGVPEDVATLTIPDMPPASARIYVYDGATFAP